MESVLVYLDDVIVYSPDFESHLQHLEKVFQAMEKYGLKLQPDKCHLLQREVSEFRWTQRKCLQYGTGVPRRR